MKATDAVAALGALGSGPRLAVFRLLVKRGPEGFTPGELSEKLQVPPPTLSFHLKELERAALVKSRREGRFICYSANFVRMNELLAYLTENCCSLSSECDPACRPRKPARVRKVRQAEPA